MDLNTCFVKLSLQVSSLFATGGVLQSGEYAEVALFDAVVAVDTDGDLQFGVALF